jgi:hypothetical protein
MVNDIYGESDILEHRYVVIYDSEGGFVTGGGWIDSPLGASVLYPEATGIANFGFVSKYKKEHLSQLEIPNLNLRLAISISGVMSMIGWLLLVLRPCLKAKALLTGR